MISPVNLTTYHNQYSPAFKNRTFPKYAAPAERSVQSLELLGRKLFNKLFDFFPKKQYKELFEQFLKSNENTENFILLLNQISRILATQKEVEINIETNRLQEIAESKEPRIFVMNHDNQKQDPKMLAFFNTLLNEEYISHGLAETCPRPRIILNEDIIRSMNRQNQTIFNKLGAVGIDANLYSADSMANAKTFISLLRDFINGKINIFIFPEGKNAAFKKNTLSQRFQLGVAEIVAKLTDKMPRVIVTPLAFAYGKKANPDSIYIGNDIVFTKQGKHFNTSIGNISSIHANPNYQQFFNGRENANLTDKGNPVEGKESAQYIGGIICENLRICKEHAQFAL